MYVFDLIAAHPRIFAAVVVPLCFAIGYFYRLRREKRENLREALYILLEIWHRVTALSKVAFDKEFKVLFGEMKKHFPNENISDEQVAALKEYISPILLSNLHGMILSDYGSFEGAYLDAVKKVSKDDPILAYKVSSASKTRKCLTFMDKYLDEALSPLEEKRSIGFSSLLKKHVQSYVKKDLIVDLENNMKSLSRRISIFAYFEVYTVIRKRRRILDNSAQEEVGKLVKEVLVPAIIKFKENVPPTS